MKCMRRFRCGSSNAAMNYWRPTPIGFFLEPTLRLAFVRISACSVGLARMRASSASAAALAVMY